MFKLVGCIILFLLCLTLYYNTNKRYYVKAISKEVTQNISIILQTVRRIIVTFFTNTTSTIIQEKKIVRCFLFAKTATLDERE